MYPTIHAAKGVHTVHPVQEPIPVPAIPVGESKAAPGIADIVWLRTGETMNDMEDAQGGIDVDVIAKFVDA